MQIRQKQCKTLPAKEASALTARIWEVERELQRIWEKHVQTVPRTLCLPPEPRELEASKVVVLEPQEVLGRRELQVPKVRHAGELAGLFGQLGGWSTGVRIQQLQFVLRSHNKGAGPLSVPGSCWAGA